MSDTAHIAGKRMPSTGNEQISVPTDGASHARVKLDMPTPVEVAAQLSDTFTEDQAADIAEYVYQPIRDMLEAMENAKIGR